MDPQVLNALAKAEGMIKYASSVIDAIKEERDKLRHQKMELIEKLAERDLRLEVEQVVDEMICRDIIQPEERSVKVAEIIKSGTSPEVYKKAMELKIDDISLGRLSDAPLSTSDDSNPMERAILGWLENNRDSKF